MTLSPRESPQHALPEKLVQLLDLLTHIEERSERIDFLIQVADRCREVPAQIAVRPFPEANKVPACESQAYVWAEPRLDGTLKFHFAVLNPHGISAKAMAVILDETLSGEPAAAVARVQGDVVYQIFGNELSMGKSMGLMAMVAMVRNSAEQALTQAHPGPN